MSKNSKKPIHEKMISQLELPKDLMLGAAIVTITGRKEVLVENYKGIIELEDSLVKIQTKNCRLQILGAHLTVEYYTTPFLTSINVCLIMDQIFSWICVCASYRICHRAFPEFMWQPQHFNLEFKTNGRWVLFLYQRGWLPQFKANLKKNKDKGAYFKKIRCAVSTVPLPET